ncbi:hypothetical protein M3Y94_00761100 [Aphelenchoides besseyi]|nr:hypothetical protein M3Y94_00761100 [Aphelenchoides besseyi]KAI6232169.1 Aspartate aminotransferase [Aphelenchoides besseyi]
MIVTHATCFVKIQSAFFGRCLLFGSAPKTTNVICSSAFHTSNINQRTKMQFAVPNTRRPSIFADIKPINEASIHEVPKDAINLSVETYRDENGNPWSLPVVREVEKALADDTQLSHGYCEDAMGDQLFVQNATHLLLGSHYKATKDQVVAIQTVSATGALRLGFEFIARVLDAKRVLIAMPSWSDYGCIVRSAGIETTTEYPYWDFENRKLAFEPMIHALSEAEPGSVVVLQCGHNPTGVDPDISQWRRIGELLKDRDLIPFFDVANVGLCSGSTQEDSYAIRLFIEMNLEFFVAQSFSKNFGLYSERVGNLIVMSQNGSKTREIKQYLQEFSRGLWTSPPMHGARIVGRVLNVNYLRQKWYNQVNQMYLRIKKSRKDLRRLLEEKQTPGTWNHLTEAHGIFSLIGLTQSQLNYLAKKHNIYTSDIGRINVTVLTEQNIEQIATAIDDAARQD